MAKDIQGQLTIFDVFDIPKPESKAQTDYLFRSPTDITTKPQIFRYLRHGPHTLVESVREEARRYLEENGVPDWVKWKKDSLPCANCTWYDGNVCISGGHTCHFEFDYLICDKFYQSIVERKPETVGK